MNVCQSFSLCSCNELIALSPQVVHTLADIVGNDGTPRCKIINSIFSFFLLQIKSKLLSKGLTLDVVLATDLSLLCI